MAHYSWDYAQQLHYPTNPQQPGPIYFKTARKCGIFDIVNKASGTQFNYLIDEAVSSGKGANTTISYVHNYLECHGMGETTAYFHADNCTGKVNKSNIVLVLVRIKKGFFCKIIKHFFFQAEDGIRDQPRSRGLGDVYKRQILERSPIAITLLLPSRISPNFVLELLPNIPH